MVDKSQNITRFINESQNIKGEDIPILDELVKEYPYFQIGQILLLKGLQNTDSIRYNQQLKKSAAYSLNRQKLFKFITSNEKNELKISENSSSNDIEKKLGIKSPLKFSQNENHSFSEWMKLLKVNKINRSVVQDQHTLVNKFINKEEVIKRPKKEAFFKAINIAKESLIENDELVTPTLARVYLEQKHYQKAIFAYKKLILKYPEKSSFFVSQIKLISKLNNK